MNTENGLGRGDIPNHQVTSVSRPESNDLPKKEPWFDSTYVIKPNVVVYQGGGQPVRSWGIKR